MRVILIAGIVLALGCGRAWAQSTPADKPGPAAKPDPSASVAALETPVPVANPADVRSVDALMGAIYDVISGPAGPRDWNRFRALMLPKARLTESTVDQHGHTSLRQWSVEEFIALAQQGFSKKPFYEHAIVNHAQRFGNIAQVFTSYASRTAPNASPFQRGINSMQLVYDGKRWWVLSILWDTDRPGNALPKAMGG